MLSLLRFARNDRLHPQMQVLLSASALLHFLLAYAYVAGQRPLRLTDHPCARTL